MSLSFWEPWPLRATCLLYSLPSQHDLPRETAWSVLALFLIVCSRSSVWPWKCDPYLSRGFAVEGEMWDMCVHMCACVCVLKGSCSWMCREREVWRHVAEWVERDRRCSCTEERCVEERCVWRKKYMAVWRMQRDVAVQRSARCVAVLWRMCGECNCVKINVIMSRDVWLCSREMYAFKGRYVSVCKEM